jgi:RNA 3'-terminal phosphate cyclase (ATP)
LNDSILTIDGSRGEGGGQIVRTSLALSALTGQAIRITHLRANRSRPGLMRQHLAAVKAAAAICKADVLGDSLGSREITFRPKRIEGGDYSFGVETAGSTTLILQTILPALMTAGEPSTLTLTGGTHNPFAPPFDFLQRAFLPFVNRMGPQVELSLVRPGFFPVGGGKFTVKVTPARELRGFDLLERGTLISQKVQALVSKLPLHIGERECQTIAAASNWSDECFETREVLDARGPGNVVMIEVDYEHVTELFVGFGQKGIRAEQVAAGVWKEAAEYLTAGVPVGMHLADQLLLPLGLAAAKGDGGSFRTLALTQHSRTHMDVLRMFLNISIQIEERSENDIIVKIE